MLTYIFRYLANQIEEEDDSTRKYILCGALGLSWRLKMSSFMSKKNKLFERLHYRGIVSKECCDTVSPNYNRKSLICCKFIIIKLIFKLLYMKNITKLLTNNISYIF